MEGNQNGERRDGALQPKDENIDAFWDIRDMVPRRTAPKRPPVQGSPQASPAIMVFISPVTKCSCPSFACAVRNTQFA